MKPERYDLDLGDEHYLAFTQWAPDRDLNPQYDGIPDCQNYGALVYHQTQTGEECGGAIVFKGPVQAILDPERPSWQVERWDPLTLSPSILCGACGDHGHIKDGRWERA